jgi:cell division septal protein FtsQ
MNPNMIILKKRWASFFSQRRLLRENFKMNITSTYIMVLLFIWVLGIYYVWTLNCNATKWYNVRQLELVKKNLTIEKELLEVRVAELESLNWLLSSSIIKNMEKIESPEYIISDNSQLAFVR